MPGNIICLKTQQAIKAFLDAKTQEEIGAIPQSNIFRGLTGRNATLPAIVVQCEIAEHSPEPLTGTWIATVAILVRQSVDDTDEDEHLLDVGTVFDLFMQQLIASDISAAAVAAGLAYTAFDVQALTQAYTIDGDVWESEAMFKFTCCGSVIT
jgi:hypothetical protein